MKIPAASGPARQLSESLWVLILLLTFFLQWAAPMAQPAPISDPRRVVMGRTIDLTPLFHWWTNHSGDRPLRAWVQVRGTITSKSASGWVVSGNAERSTARAGDSDGQASAPAAAHQFLLKNPPIQDEAEFERLHQELTQANADRGRLANEESNAKSAAHHARGRAATQVHRAEHADEVAVKSLDQKISDLKKKLAVYGSSDHYEVDVIALDTGTESNHLPVFDRGMVFK
jgi:hypothetical protein